MKLHDITRRQFGVIESDHNAWEIDITREEDEYTLVRTTSATWSQLNSADLETVCFLIADGGLPEEDETITLYELTCEDEAVLLYIPDSWD